MELSFNIKSEKRPSFSDIGDKSFSLNFTTRNQEKEKLKVLFKIKIKETLVEIFMLNDQNIEVREIEKMIAVEPGEQQQSIDLRLRLKKRPDKSRHVDIILFVENTDLKQKIVIRCS